MLALKGARRARKPAGPSRAGAPSFWQRYGLVLILAAIFPLTIVLPGTGLINPYVNLVLKYIGINIMLTVSLNLVNGYMGEFSVGHAGFMAIGA